MGDRDSAVNFYNQAVTACNDKSDPGNLQVAYQLFTSAVIADPTWAEAQYQLGNNNSDLSLLPAAIANYRRVLETPNLNDEIKSKTLANIGWRLHGLGLNEEAKKCSKAALAIDPTLAYAWLNLSIIYGAFKQADRAVECGIKAHELAPTDNTIKMGLAFALLFARKFQDGFYQFEARFPYKLTNFLQYPYPKWLGEPGRTIFVVADQGIGDTLSFSRFLETACQRSKQIIATVQPEFMRLFSHSFSHVPNLTLLPSPCPFPAADHWSTFVSLPFALGLSDQEVRNQPNIKIPLFQLPAPWKLSDRKLHIGIAYAGSALNEINKYRSIDLRWFLELYRVPGIQLYSLQVSDEHKQITEQGCGALIPDLKPWIRDLCDTYSILHELDLVITIESALGHIAGMIDMPCWIPYSHQGRDYRIGHDGSDILWYKNHKVFQQGPDLSWEPVFFRMVRHLRQRVHGD